MGTVLDELRGKGIGITLSQGKTGNRRNSRDLSIKKKPYPQILPFKIANQFNFILCLSRITNAHTQWAQAFNLGELIFNAKQQSSLEARAYIYGNISIL